MSDPRLHRPGSGLVVVFLLGLVGFIVSELIDFRMNRQSQALQREVIRALADARAADSIATLERRGAVSTIATLRSDLDALMAAGRARSIARDRRLERLELEMRRTVAELDSTVDSVRLVLPPAKKHK